MSEQVLIENKEPTTPEIQEPTQAQSVAVEPVKVDEKEVKKEEQRSRLFAEKARADRERQIVQKENAELKNKLTAFEKEKELLKNNPIDYIKNNTGMDYEQLTKFYLKQLETEENKPSSPQKDDRVQRLEDKLAELEKEKQETAQKQQQEYTRTMINKHLGEVYNYCQKNSEQYEAILSHTDKAQNIYLDLYQQAYQLGGRDLDTSEILAAINRTEQILTEDLERQAEKLFKIKKLSSKFMTKEPEQKIEEKPVSVNNVVSKTKSAKEFKVKTISNDMTTGTSSNPIKKPLNSKTLSADEVHKQKLAAIAAKFDH